MTPCDYEKNVQMVEIHLTHHKITQVYGRQERPQKNNEKHHKRTFTCGSIIFGGKVSSKFLIFVARSSWFFAIQGGLPVSMKYNVAPRANTSMPSFLVKSMAELVRNSSGAMNAGVPPKATYACRNKK